MNVKQKLMLEVFEKDRIFIHIASKKLSNLEVKRSDGKPLFIAPNQLIYSESDWQDVEDVVEREKRAGGNPIVIFLKRHDDKDVESTPTKTEAEKNPERSWF